MGRRMRWEAEGRVVDLSRLDALMRQILRLQRWFRQRRLRRLGKVKGDGIGSATDSLLNAQRAKCGGAGGCCVVM